MQRIHEGQCGLCSFFKDHNGQLQQVIEDIQRSYQAPEDLVVDCDHPQHASLSLRVTPISGCKGFKPAPLLVSGTA
ncbi:MAG TPA: hypothetical protein PL151_01050 [Phycisphaerae bacterium]|nr:hypothetical protein [Phycisphaerae bacterium]HOJ74542.1 hypothetical protein [Phycisphaerae bacterium]HOM52743.1 hypothetical protein [Phycisphaerae bacterium]HON66205.1 hypothetical protein [Phycisphaerae bacterium]HOQ88093.1 hypothetical protein [Phycisphaerae bacterium]